MITMVAMRKYIAPILIALIALTSAMPAQASLLGGKFTLRDEMKMGREFDKMIRASMPMVEDPLIVNYVKGIVDKIVEAKAPMPFKVRSRVVRNDALNAFAIPGGYIYIFTGLINAVKNESELAAVIAHELAHVSQRHVAKRIEKSKQVSTLSVAGMLAGVLLGAGGGEGAANVGSALIVGTHAAAQSAMLKHSRDDENEADHVGMNSLVGAGYDPDGMVETFKIMMRSKLFSGGGDIPSYFSTHPGLHERVGYLSDRIARMPASLVNRKDDNTTLVRVQALTHSQYADQRIAMGYYDNIPRTKYTPLDWMGRGIALKRLKRMKEARTCFEKALALDPKDPLILREGGAFYFKIGESNKAIPLLQQAVFKNPSDLMAIFFLSRIMAERKDYGQAEELMKRVLKSVPHDWEVHYHLGLIQGQSGNSFGGHLHLSYSWAYRFARKKAVFQYRKAATLAETEAQKKKLGELKKVLQDRKMLPPDGKKKGGKPKGKSRS